MNLQLFGGLGGMSGGGGGSEGGTASASAVASTASTNISQNATGTLGQLVHTYRDGTQTYEAPANGITASALNSDQKSWVRAMDNVVRNDIRNALQADGIRSGDAQVADIDINAGTATAFVHVSRQASASGLGKAHYDVQFDFTKRTTVRPNGTQRTDWQYNGVKLRLRGVNAY